MVSLNYKSLNREDNLEIASPTSFQFFFFPEGIVNTYLSGEVFINIFSIWANNFESTKYSLLFF